MPLSPSFPFIVLVLFTLGCFVTAFFSWEEPLKKLDSRRPALAQIALACCLGFLAAAALERDFFWEVSHTPSSGAVLGVGIVLCGLTAGAAAVALRLALSQALRLLKSLGVRRRSSAWQSW